MENVKCVFDLLKICNFLNIITVQNTQKFQKSAPIGTQSNAGRGRRDRARGARSRRRAARGRRRGRRDFALFCENRPRRQTRLSDVFLPPAVASKSVFCTFLSPAVALKSVFRTFLSPAIALLSVCWTFLHPAVALKSVFWTLLPPTVATLR